MFDLIGDIHGQASELEAILGKLGYQHKNGCYFHARRKIIFLGDFVDRGPNQRQVLNIVRPMIESGTALAVMGNHEYNAIAYFTKDADGDHLRSRTNKNTAQHRAFLDAYQADEDGWADMIEWFKTLPMWIEHEGLRVVHACWDQSHIDRIHSEYGPQASLTEDLLHRSAIHGTWEHSAVETLLKGKEITLPDGAYFYDKDGNRRHEIRVQWWGQGTTYRDLYMGPESARMSVSNETIGGDHSFTYRSDEKPVFIGHYWMEGEPAPLAENITCLDYSVAKPGGKLVAYRWDGEQRIDPSKYVVVKRLR